MTYLISTDLDGTLQDHYNYSWQAAQQALSVRREQKIPVIINTAKTLLEVREIQKAIGIRLPMIIENGSALILPFIACDRKINFDYFNQAGAPVEIYQMKLDGSRAQHD